MVRPEASGNFFSSSGWLVQMWLWASIHPAERLFRVAQPERLRAVMDCNAWRRFMGFG